MSTFLSIVLVLVAYIVIKFLWDLSKDSGDLAKIPVEKRFPIITEIINQAAFQGKGTITKADRRAYSLYEDGKNQIIFFMYSTGSLTINWKFKYFQQEVVYEKIFPEVRDITDEEQERIADIAIREAFERFEQHQKRVLGA